jgi:hypothetical protein
LRQVARFDFPVSVLIFPATLDTVPKLVNQKKHHLSAYQHARRGLRHVAC